MITLWKRSTLLGRGLFVVAVAVFAAQLFFVPDYANDKTVMIEQMARSYAEHGGIAGREIGCRDFATQVPGFHRRWVEEFPIFPYTAVAFSKVLPGDTWRRVTPWFYHAIAWFLFAWILFRHAFGERREFLEVASLYALLPIVVIHATKAVPEPAIISLGLAGLALFLTGRRVGGAVFVFFAGLAKPLVLALVAPFALGWILFGEPGTKRRFLAGMGMGVAAVAGVLAWIAFLYFSDIDNPLIRSAAYRAAATTSAESNGVGAAMPMAQYWSRYVTWVATRGVSWPGIVLVIAGLFQLFRNRGAALREAPVFVRVATVMALFSPAFWFLVRGPQYTGPWYTLYVTIGLFTIAAYAYLRIRSEAARFAIALMVLASALPKVSWELSAIDVYRAPMGSAFRNPDNHVDCSVQPIIRAVF